MKNLLYIGNKLSQHGFSVTTIETLGPLFESEGFIMKYSSSKKNKLLRLLQMLWATFKNRNKIDYVLIDTYSSSNFWYAFLVSQLARFFKLKYIPILHGGNLPQRLNQSKWASELLFKNSHQNVSPSEYLLKAFISKKYLNTIYIPNSIELEKYTFEISQIIVPKLLWVRSFAKIYNPMMAIEVFKIVKNKFPEASLCMVGPDKDGSLEEVKKKATAYNLNVDFTGKLSKEQWVLLSKNYNIFINTTHFDNMPVSVIEAMALGIPVVSTDVGGLKYLLTDQKNALLVADNDAVAMAKAIFLLSENNKFKTEISESARAKVEDFDWNKVKNNWKETLI